MTDDNWMHINHQLSKPFYEAGFSLLETLAALAIFSGSYIALISAHAHITSHTQKQARELYALIEISNQHEIQIALQRVEEDK